MEERKINSEETKMSDHQKRNEIEIVKLLTHLGFGNKGYYFLKTALTLLLDGECNLIDYSVNYLCARVAVIHRCRTSMVERGIRHAIEKSYNEKRLHNLDELFSFNVIYCMPTMSELLPMLEEYLRVFCHCA